MNIQRVTTVTPAHWRLLLMADPERAAITRYLPQSTVWEALNTTDNLIGILVLQSHGAALEIMNRAVAPAARRQHVATNLLTFAKHYGNRHHFVQLMVGTGSTSFAQLALYQKVGFRLASIDRDFFTSHYSKPIYENGIRLRDMVRLIMPLMP